MPDAAAEVYSNAMLIMHVDLEAPLCHDSVCVDLSYEQQQQHWVVLTTPACIILCLTTAAC